jgi:hypothetical protein
MSARASRIPMAWTKLTAHKGKELKLCAEANAASRAVTTTVRGDMANFLAIVDCERRIDLTLDDRVILRCPEQNCREGATDFNGPGSGSPCSRGFEARINFANCSRSSLGTEKAIGTR